MTVMGVQIKSAAQVTQVIKCVIILMTSVTI